MRSFFSFFFAAFQLALQRVGRRLFIAAHQRRDHVLQLVVLAEVAQRAFAGHGFQTPHAAGDAAFFQNLDQPDLAGCAGVRAAAELGGEVADLDDAHAIAILLAEQRHGLVLVDGDVDGHVFDDLDAIVAQHFFVGEVFDVLQLFVVDAGEVREVEAQVAGIDQRARLLHMRAQHVAQRRMQQVRAGVVAHGRVADLGVDHGVDLVADVDGLLGGDAMRAHALHRDS